MEDEGAVISHHGDDKNVKASREEDAPAEEEKTNEHPSVVPSSSDTVALEKSDEIKYDN